MEDYKISFCIVCMNRLHHLKETLPANLAGNKNYKNLEFVLLDYNSTDGLESYIKETHCEEVKTGRLVYYKTTTPKYFNRSHSRNLVHKLASGDLLCNIDADNFSGENFAEFINKEFKNNSKVFLTPIGAVGSSKDVLGRTCLKKADFVDLRGYDERMINYGFEDYDFVNRLELNGLTKRPIPSESGFLKAITHDEKERLSNEILSANLVTIYACYLTPSKTDLLFLLKDKFFKGTIVKNNNFQNSRVNKDSQETQYTHSILQKKWIEGLWNLDETALILYPNNADKEVLPFNKTKSILCVKSDVASAFYEITSKNLIEEALMFLSQITNRMLMEENRNERMVAVNSEHYGKDTVYKNFDYSNFIQI